MENCKLRLGNLRSKFFFEDRKCTDKCEAYVDVVCNIVTSKCYFCFLSSWLEWDQTWFVHEACSSSRQEVEHVSGSLRCNSVLIKARKRQFTKRQEFNNGWVLKQFMLNWNTVETRYLELDSPSLSRAEIHFFGYAFQSFTRTPRFLRLFFISFESSR